MARMIPVTCSNETKSKAERILFEEFRSMPGTDDWTVLHSVHIARHPSQSEGEADFTVIIPGRGTFVLEVKGGIIEFENGAWYSTTKAGNVNSIKDPVNEAGEAMHAFTDFIAAEEKYGEHLEKCLFGFGVVFPDSEFRQKDAIPDLDRAQIADIHDLHDMKTYLLRLSNFWKERASWKRLPDNGEAKRIVSLLRPEISGELSLFTQIQNIENQIITLTQNQEAIYRGMLCNDRCLIQGGAGTGKTILAVNIAKQYAIAGKRTAVFCYNLKLADHLKKSICEEKVLCESFTEYMDRIVSEYAKEQRESVLKAAEDSGGNWRKKYYYELLPELFFEIYLEQELPRFSCLVLDEAQDLITKPFLAALDVMLEGGLKDGYWYFFMDTEHQNLFHSSVAHGNALRFLNEYQTYYTKLMLDVNCRNSRSIVEKVNQIFGTSTEYRVDAEQGKEITVRFYKNGSSEQELIRSSIRELHDGGVPDQHIVILSPYTFIRSTASKMTDLSMTQTEGETGILFSTIPAFKGLESPVVILIDFEDAEKRLKELYVGMTRARSRLYIIAHEKNMKLLN